MQNGKINEFIMAALVGHYRNGATVEEMSTLTGFAADFIEVFITGYLKSKGEAPDARIMQQQKTDI